MKKINRYVFKILSYIECDSLLRKKLRDDLLSDISSRSDIEDISDPYELMGNPKDVALEIIERHNLKLSPGFEYISDTKIFGLPLIHISSRKRGVAMGVLAIGLKSVGVLSFGILSLGIVSFGIISIGVLTAIGSLSIGLLLSVGALSISAYMSVGAIAISSYISLGAIAISNNISIGAISIGKVAVGARAYGEVAIYSEYGKGTTTINMYTQKDLVEPAIREFYNKDHIVELVNRMFRLK